MCVVVNAWLTSGLSRRASTVRSWLVGVRPDRAQREVGPPLAGSGTMGAAVDHRREESSTRHIRVVPLDGPARGGSLLGRGYSWCPPGAVLVASPQLVAPPLAVSGMDVELLLAGANMVLVGLRHGLNWDVQTGLTRAAEFVDPCMPAGQRRTRVEHALALVAEHLAACRSVPQGTAVHDLLGDLDGEAALRAVRGAASRYHLILLYAALGADGLLRYLLASAGHHPEEAGP